MKDQPPSPEELAAAEALRRALDGETDARDDEDAQAAAMIAASVGRPSRLGDLAARGVVRRAMAEAARKSSLPGDRSLRRWRVGGMLGAAAAAMILFTLVFPATPRRWQSRSAGLLVPGPFPRDQTAAQRLDVITTDRMIAFRDARLYGARR